MRKNGEIVLSSAPFDRIFRLDSGRLAVTTSNSSGEEVLMRHIAPGEFFGEFCFCGEGTGPHDFVSARATEASQVIEIRASAFLRSIDESPAALRSFVASVCRHLAGADRRIFALAHRGAEERLGLLLLELSANAPAGGASPSIRASHAEIAGLAAMSRPHVSVILGRFREQGLVSYRRQGPMSVHRARMSRYLDRVRNDAN